MITAKSGPRSADGGGAERGRHPRTRRRPLSRRPRRLVAVLAALVAVAACVSIVLALPARPGRSLAASHSRGTGDPFSGVRLFVDPHSQAVQAEASLARSDPSAAALLRKIASRPAGIWLGGWLPVTEAVAVVRSVLREAAARNSIPLLVLYAFPYHGCAQDPAATAAYERWVGQVAAGIGSRAAAVILEPDVLAQYIRLGCLSPAAQQDRLAVLRRVVDKLAGLPHTAVYIDAGNSTWRSPAVMAALLVAAGVRDARGFSLNVSNFNSTAAEKSYGDRLSAILRGTHYVIDTSRNGTATAKTWCNPPGQALGVPPTATTGDPLVDALLWIKQPGASDGTCNGGPPAGMFWLSYALALAANAQW